MRLAICILILAIVFVTSDAAQSRSGSRSRSKSSGSSRPRAGGTRKNNQGIGTSSNSRTNSKPGTSSNSRTNSKPGTSSNTGTNSKPGTSSNTGTNNNPWTNGKTNTNGGTGGTNGKTGTVDKDPSFVKPGDKSKKYPPTGNVNGKFPSHNRPKPKVPSKAEVRNFNVKMATVISVGLSAFKQRHRASAFCNHHRLTTCTSTPITSLSSQTPLLSETCRNYQTIIRCDRHCPGFFHSMQQTFQREQVRTSTFCPDVKTDGVGAGGGGMGIEGTGDFRTDGRQVWDNDRSEYSNYKGGSATPGGSVCTLLSLVICLVLSSV